MKGLFPILAIGVILMSQADFSQGAASTPIKCLTCADAATCTAQADVSTAADCTGATACFLTTDATGGVQSRGCGLPADTEAKCDGATPNRCTCIAEDACNLQPPTATTGGGPAVGSTVPGGTGGGMTTAKPGNMTGNSTSSGIASIPVLVLGMAGVHLKYDL